ncbi:MAG: hypothetical protein J6M31_01815 [Bacteroidales bacterium]|nr:hypothetical protein [Bacteroidales bacterium]
MCLLVLAACSPRYFNGGQVARTSSHESAADSTGVHRTIDYSSISGLQQNIDWKSSMDVTTVKEVLSAPDSSGRQYVIERTTTTAKTQSQSASTATQTKEENLQASVDSTSHVEKEQTQQTEQKKNFSTKVRVGPPWYVWVIGVLILTAAVYVLFKRFGTNFFSI